jgi:hypothetical protein
MIDRMSRDELLVAIYFSTPLVSRFSNRPVPEDATAAEHGAALAWKACTLGDFSDDGLRSVLRYWDSRENMRLSKKAKEGLSKLVEAAYQFAILNVVDKASA